ncbi:hypothetical protein PoB_006817700 [Plakobranchus ocellatus]|uniref:SWIM-type domain-containing protein n=1 Tax=Plakobranchus ocellatus TaxID=259542 RepID=A0AAV4DBN7_9GAST|nr:hypothetical protein PoB_006817700 [Plakobranchus ocellatus]
MRLKKVTKTKKKKVGRGRQEPGNGNQERWRRTTRKEKKYKIDNKRGRHSYAGNSSCSPHDCPHHTAHNTACGHITAVAETMGRMTPVFGGQCSYTRPLWTAVTLDHLSRPLHVEYYLCLRFSPGLSCLSEHAPCVPPEFWPGN